MAENFIDNHGYGHVMNWVLAGKDQTTETNRSGPTFSVQTNAKIRKTYNKRLNYVVR